MRDSSSNLKSVENIVTILEELGLTFFIKLFHNS